VSTPKIKGVFGIERLTWLAGTSWGFSMYPYFRAAPLGLQYFPIRPPLCLNGPLDATIATRTKALRFFIGLQCSDALTTLVFLSWGIQEGNPLVSWAVSRAHAPWIGLVLAKLIVALIGLYCYRTGRLTLLRRANVGYSLVVGWNLVAIAAAVVAR
jgi:hypothetical protein